MESINFKYYKIDLADVWEYEREKFIAGETNEKLAQKLLDLIQPLVIKYGEPSFGHEMIAIDSIYYGRNILEYHGADLRMKYALNYFIHKDDCYEYNQTILITGKEEEFPFFFALKMRQYNDNLFEVNSFLQNQLSYSFDDDMVSYSKFLGICLFQFDSFFQQGLKSQINQFLVNSESGNETKELGNLAVSGHDQNNKLNEFNGSETESNTLKSDIEKQVIGLKNQESHRKIITDETDKSIWSGTDSQLEIFYKQGNGILFDDISKDEFFNHFKGKEFQNRINWISGNDGFIELFDKLSTEKLIDQHFTKQNNQFKDRLVILISKINRHFLFNGIEKNVDILNKSRHQFYQSSMSSAKHEVIGKLINDLKL
jgi:hypothetical protein